MSNNAITIKTLRQNFIKRHQLSADFFTNTEHQEPSYLFTDMHVLTEKQIHIKNTPTYLIPVKISAKRHRPSLSEHQVNPKNTKTVNPEVKNFQITNHNGVSQPSFVKADKLKKSASARTTLSLPKYATFLLKPCSVQTVKMQNRPQSAFSVVKNQLQQASRVRTANREPRRRKKSEVLKPWDVEEEELFNSRT